jgi:uncharacterized protein GlcG (DUF336 family)
MRLPSIARVLLVLSFGALQPLAARGQQLPNAYGAPIPAETARKAAAAALAEARRNGWTVAAAVVDPGGTLVYFERIDGTQAASSHVAVEKARSSVAFKRPTKALEDAIAGGRTNVLGLPGAIPLEGGVPLVVDNRIVGAIGVSGGTSQQDGVCAKAGADALATAPPHK